MSWTSPLKYILLCGAFLRLLGQLSEPLCGAVVTLGPLPVADISARLWAVWGSTGSSPLQPQGRGQKMISDYTVHEWALAARKLGSVRPHADARLSSCCTESAAALSSKTRRSQSQLPSGVMATAEGRLGGWTEHSRSHTAKWSGFVCGECGRSYAFTLISWA